MKKLLGSPVFDVVLWAIVVFQALLLWNEVNHILDLPEECRPKEVSLHVVDQGQTLPLGNGVFGFPNLGGYSEEDEGEVVFEVDHYDTSGKVMVGMKTIIFYCDENVFGILELPLPPTFPEENTFEL